MGLLVSSRTTNNARDPGCNFCRSQELHSKGCCTIVLLEVKHRSSRCSRGGGTCVCVCWVGEGEHCLLDAVNVRLSICSANLLSYDRGFSLVVSTLSPIEVGTQIYQNEISFPHSRALSTPAVNKIYTHTYIYI